MYGPHKTENPSLRPAASKAGRAMGSSFALLFALFNHGFEACTGLAPENDLSSTSCPLFSIQKAPTADSIVTPASEQIIEMHQWRRSVGVEN